MHFLISILKILLSTIIEKQIFCYQFPKQEKIYYYIFRRLIPFSGIRRLFYYHKGGFYYYDRYRKGTLAGPAPIGGSSGTEPSERAKGKDTQAHSNRGNSGKGAAGSANDGATDIGGIPITKNTTERLKHSEGLRATGGLSLFPEGRTYSPPATGRRWYPSLWSGTRALRGGLRFLRKATDDATALASAAVTVCAAGHIAPNRRYGLLPATNLPPAALSQRWTALPPCPFSLLRKRNRKRG